MYGKIHQNEKGQECGGRVNFFFYWNLTLVNIGHDTRKSAPGFGNNKGADQPAHPRRLINTFVIRFLEYITSKLA